MTEANRSNAGGGAEEFEDLAVEPVTAGVGAVAAGTAAASISPPDSLSDLISSFVSFSSLAATVVLMVDIICGMAADCLSSKSTK